MHVELLSSPSSYKNLHVESISSSMWFIRPGKVMNLFLKKNRFYLCSFRPYGWLVGRINQFPIKIIIKRRGCLKVN